MKTLCLALIALYQRFISPRKGFHCAHHRLHKGDTCSNAVKQLIKEHNLRQAWPLIRARFDSCKEASLSLAAQYSNVTPTSDLPCDVGCAADLPCSGGDSDCLSPFDLCIDLPSMSRRTRRIVMIIVAILIVAGLYVYGSQISKIEITQVSAAERSDGLVKRLLNREKPSLRVLVLHGTKKVYSNVKALNTDEPMLLTFNRSISLNDVNKLELHDARLSAGGDLIVVGQMLERFDRPAPVGVGDRFRYEFKSRWGF